MSCYGLAHNICSAPISAANESTLTRIACLKAIIELRKMVLNVFFWPEFKWASGVGRMIRQDLPCVSMPTGYIITLETSDAISINSFTVLPRSPKLSPDPSLVLDCALNSRCKEKGFHQPPPWVNLRIRTVMQIPSHELIFTWHL